MICQATADGPRWEAGRPQRIAVLPAVVDIDDLMVRRVATGAPNANARRDLAVLVGPDPGRRPSRNGA